MCPFVCVVIGVVGHFCCCFFFLFFMYCTGFSLHHICLSVAVWDIVQGF